MTLSTQSMHFTADAKLQKYIEKKFKKLKRLYSRIINASIVLRRENSNFGDRNIAEIKLSLPGNVLFVREAASSFEASIDQAVNAILLLLSQKNLMQA